MPYTFSLFYYQQAFIESQSTFLFICSYCLPCKQSAKHFIFFSIEAFFSPGCCSDVSCCNYPFLNLNSVCLELFLYISGNDLITSSLCCSCGEEEGGGNSLFLLYWLTQFARTNILPLAFFLTTFIQHRFKTSKKLQCTNAADAKKRG